MTNYCFTVPILPGGIELMKKWNQENIINNKAHDSAFKAVGISREQVWIQHLPQGDFAVVSFETDDIGQSFKVLAKSKDPWSVKFREHLNKAHGLDIVNAAMQLNEQIADWNQ